MSQSGILKAGWTIAVLAIVVIGFTLEYQAEKISFMHWLSVMLLVGTIFWLRGNMVLRGQR